jgi:hypothetical protein
MSGCFPAFERHVVPALGIQQVMAWLSARCSKLLLEAGHFECHSCGSWDALLWSD